MFNWTTIAVVLLATTAINFAVSYISWRRRKARGGIYFALGMAGVTLWTLAAALDYGAVPLGLKILFAKLEAIGYHSALALFAVFTMSYTGKEHWLKKTWVKALLAGIPLTNILLTVTNELHNWIWTGFIRKADNIVVFEHGPAFYWGIITNYLLVIFMFLNVWMASRKGSDITRRQARILMFALLFPAAVNLVYQLGTGGIEGVDWTSLTFSVSGLLILYSLHGIRLLDIVPIARDKLVNNLSDGMIVLDLQKRIIDVNHAAAAIFNARPENMIGSDLADFASLNLSVWDQPLEYELRTELQVGAENKRYFDVLLSPLRDEAKGIIGGLIIFRDISRLKENELRLLQLTQAVEQSPASVVITDPGGNITYVNPKFTALTGYSLHEVIGKNPKIIQSGQTPVEVYQNMWETIQSGQPWRGEFLNKKKNGDLYWEFEVIAPVLDSEGQIINFISVKEDISERKRAEQALEERFLEIQGLHQDLQESQAQIVEQQRNLATFEERQRLGRDMHDSVNQSIHSLMLYSETLIALLGKRNIKKAVDVAERIQESGRQALKEIRLLIYETQSILADDNMDLINALEERLNMVERRVGIRGHIISADGAAGRYPPEWNPNLFWMIMEAMNNSLKHAQARNIDVIINCTENHLELEIADDGAGFEPGRLSAGGWGMRTMRERAEMLGGQLRVESSPGHGTRVHFKAELETRHEEDKNPDRG